MTVLPKIPKSAVAVLQTAGVESLEDAAAWSEDELAGLRGFGPKAFQTVKQAMADAGLEFDSGSEKRSDPINVAMAKERMKGVPEIPEDHGLPKIGSPATRALTSIGVLQLDQVAAMTREDVLALHGVGPKAVRILEDALHEQGLGFKSE